MLQSLSGARSHDAARRQSQKVYLYLKPVHFRKPIGGLASLAELNVKLAVFDPVPFVFLNNLRNRVKVLCWSKTASVSGKHLGLGRFAKSSPHRLGLRPDHARAQLVAGRFRSLAQCSMTSFTLRCVA
ncbi:IS66 family insertion sequence element accessory protein TnpB [Pseudomonas putida]|uniref:IS66 family insertion sequence element accessory protein TnpB n=1 Tax=Pseudomonas putida TaxID=303 RepID=UPI002115FA2A|nr:IS66 family insertion sequence element accessory protein TnpB [Pseudomonas putida]